jgi:hypothetical protein
MKRLAFLAWSLLAACASPPQKLVGDRALLVDVSSDQAWLALLTGDMRYPNGTYTGKLSIQPLGVGGSVTLDSSSSGGSFGRGRAFWFLGGVTIVHEGTPALPRYWGTLELWLPGLVTPFKVGSNVRDYSPSGDGSSAVFWDATARSQAAPGKLMVVSASTCTTGSCVPLTLAENVLLSNVQWRISSDGKFVLAVIRGANPGDPGLALLVQPATGDVQVLSRAAGTRSPMMTPVGDAIAWVEGMNRIMTTPTSAPAPMLLATSAQFVESAAMLGAGDFVARARAVPAPGMLGASSLVRVGPGGTSTLGMQKTNEIFVSQALPGVTTNFLFYSTAYNATNGVGDLWLLNLNRAGKPLQLGINAVSPIVDGLRFSDDNSMIMWLANYSPAVRLGDLYATALATPAQNLVAASVYGGAFEVASTRILYINAPDQNSGAGVLTLLPAIGKPTLVEGVGLLNFVNTRSAPLRTYYTQRTGGSDDGIWSMLPP